MIQNVEEQGMCTIYIFYRGIQYHWGQIWQKAIVDLMVLIGFKQTKKSRVYKNKNKLPYTKKHTWLNLSLKMSLTSSSEVFCRINWSKWFPPMRNVSRKEKEKGWMLELLLD